MSEYRLFHGDCLDILPSLEDASIDAIIADIPSGRTACAWDSVIPFDSMWAQLRRIIKPKGAIVLLGCTQPFTSALVMSNPEMFRYDWVWEKQQPTGFLNARREPMRAHESICVFAQGWGAYNPQGLTPTHIRNGRTTKSGKGVYEHHIKNPAYVQTEGPFPRTILKIPCIVRGQLHPTQKPLALLEYLVKTYTNAGDTVLDFAFGSGTTGAACGNLGRRFV